MLYFKCGAYKGKHKVACPTGLLTCFTVYIQAVSSVYKICIYRPWHWHCFIFYYQYHVSFHYNIWVYLSCVYFQSVYNYCASTVQYPKEGPLQISTICTIYVFLYVCMYVCTLNGYPLYTWFCQTDIYEYDYHDYG